MSSSTPSFWPKYWRQWATTEDMTTTFRLGTKDLAVSEGKFGSHRKLKNQ
jgi:hypothetical protein